MNIVVLHNEKSFNELRMNDSDQRISHELCVDGIP